MRKNSETAFLALVWIVLLLLIAHDAYEKFMKSQISHNPKTTRELIDGNP